jgi:hypothetical protein
MKKPFYENFSSFENFSDFFEVLAFLKLKKIYMNFCRQKKKIRKKRKKMKTKRKEKEKEEKKVETKEEYLPWHGRYSATLASKMGFSGWVGYIN